DVAALFHRQRIRNLDSFPVQYSAGSAVTAIRQQGCLSAGRSATLISRRGEAAARNRKGAESLRSGKRASQKVSADNDLFPVVRRQYASVSGHSGISPALEICANDRSVGFQ